MKPKHDLRFEERRRGPNTIAHQVADATRALAAADQQDLIWGHVSARDPDGRGFWMKASGIGFEETSAARVLLLDWEGRILAGDGKAHVEHPLHGEVLQRRQDIDWVVHTHPAAVNVFTSLGVPMRAISHDGVLFSHPELPRYIDGDLINTKERGEALADALADHIGCVLPAHGLICVGPSAGTAVMRTVLFTRACAAMLAALSAGGPRSWSSDTELAAKRESAWPHNQLEAGYQYLRRTSTKPIVDQD